MMLFTAAVQGFTVKEPHTAPTLILQKENKIQRPRKEQIFVNYYKIKSIYFIIKIPEHNTIFQNISIQETILENSTIFATVRISSWFTISHLLCNAFWENNLIKLSFK